MNSFLVETIVPKDDNKSQETLVLKSDGTTKKLSQKSKVSRTIVNRGQVVMQEKQKKVIEQQSKREKVNQVEKMENTQESEESDRPRLGRPLTSQEESILLPLLQGLLTANGSDSSKTKEEKKEGTSSKEKPSTSNKNSRSNSLAEKNEKSEFFSSMFQRS